MQIVPQRSTREKITATLEKRGEVIINRTEPKNIKLLIVWTAVKVYAKIL